MADNYQKGRRVKHNYEVLQLMLYMGSDGKQKGKIGCL